MPNIKYNSPAHGHSRNHTVGTYRGESPTYTTWSNIRGRCENKKHKAFKYYGGRGIEICDRWNKFENFLADMGERPARMTLDRIDNDGNYEPGNCRWATRKSQQRNTSRKILVFFKGETKPLRDWTDLLNISYGTIKARIKAGWDSDRAFLTPIRSKLPNNWRKYEASITTVPAAGPAG